MSVYTELLVSSDNEGDQRAADTAVLSDGGWITVWLTEIQFGSYRLSAQRFDSTGAKADSEIEIFAEPAQWPSNAKVMARPDGGWTVTWSDSSAKTYFQDFDENGAADSEVLQYDAVAQVHQTRVFDDGSLLYVGVAPEGGFWRATANGTITEHIENLPYTDGAGTPDAEILTDQGWVMSWHDGYSGLYMQRYDVSGAPIGETQTLDTFWQYAINPDITALNNGGWLVSWIKPEGGGLVYNRYEADGDRIVTEESIDSPEMRLDTPGKTLALDDGGWLSIWGTRQNSRFGGFYSQAYDADGSKSGERGHFGHYGPGWDLDIDKLDDDGWLVTWEGSSQDPDNGTDIYQQRFNSDGQIVFTNTAPEGHNLTINTPEDKIVAITASKFGFNDINNQDFAEVVITDIKGRGVLKVDGHKVAEGDVITTDDMRAGLVKWTPGKEDFGKDYATIEFAVRDDGNTENGGSNTDATPDRIRFNVKQVADSFIGTRGDDKLVGTWGQDKIHSRQGDDILKGNGGSDRFVFRKDHGQDVILDLDTRGPDRDHIVLEFTRDPTWYSLMTEHVKEIKGDVVIFDLTGKYPEDKIILKDIEIDDIRRDLFLF